MIQADIKISEATKKTKIFKRKFIIATAILIGIALGVGLGIGLSNKSEYFKAFFKLF